MQHNVESAALVTKAFLAALRENLRSVLLFGSAANGIGHDLDLILVLHGEPGSKTDLFSKILSVRSQFPSLKMDLHPIYESEIVDADSFTLYAQGSYLLPILAGAKVMHGDNPFSRRRPTPLALRNDALRKCREYLMRVRMAASSGKSMKSDANPDLWRKNIRKMMLDIIIAKNYQKTSRDIIGQFVNMSPKSLEPTEVEKLRQSAPLKINEALPITEKVFLGAQSLLGNDFIKAPVMRDIAGLACEVQISPNPVAKWIVICDGIPSRPHRHDLMSNLSLLGFNVVLPRYQGTWESSGEFLERDPSEDIRRLSLLLKTGTGELPTGEVTLLGSSFGGTVSLSASDSDAVQKVLAYSPVIDFESISPNMASLRRYLKSQCSGAYRFQERDWDRLQSGELVSLRSMRRLPEPKIKIFAGSLDESISPPETERFCKQRCIHYTEYQNIGHIGLSKLKNEIWHDLCLELEREV